MIRGGVYRVDMGPIRGHEQAGKRFGVVVSPTDMSWSVVTVVPTSTSAQPSVFRPVVMVAGQKTRVLCDQIRTLDVSYVSDDLVNYVTRDQMAEVDDALTRYLGLMPDRPDEGVAPVD